MRALVEHPEAEDQKEEDGEKKKRSELVLLMRAKLRIPVLKEAPRLRDDIVRKMEQLFGFEETSVLGITNLRLFAEELLTLLEKAESEEVSGAA